MSTDPTLTQQVRQAVIDAGLTYYQLAKLAGLKVGAARDFLQGNRDPRGSTIDAVAKLLGMRATKPRRTIEPTDDRGQEWTSEEIELLGKLTDAEVVEQTGHPLGSVQWKRWSIEQAKKVKRRTKKTARSQAKKSHNG